MLMSLFAICQPVYPKKAVIDNDTVTIISIEQTKTINKVFVDRDECNEMKDSLNSELKNYGDLVQGQKAIISSQDKEIDIQKKIVAEKDIIIESDAKLLKQQNRKLGWIKLQRTALAFSTLVLGITVIVLKN